MTSFIIMFFSKIFQLYVGYLFLLLTCLSSSSNTFQRQQVLYLVRYQILTGLYATKIFDEKLQLCIDLYLSQFSCLYFLSKFYFCILQSSLCSSSNYLEACKCLCLLRNSHFIMHALRRPNTCQYQH